MRLYRFGHRCHKNNIPLLPGLISRYMRVVYSIDLSCSTEIGNGTSFVHNGLGCVVNPNAIIGDNVRVLQNVTIGGRGEGRGVPIIGDDVIIGCGACILGGVKIGNGCKIGANAVVLTDVPDNAVAVGIPARILDKNR